MRNAERHIVIWTDGGARGNPGPAGIGAVIRDAKGRLLAEISEYVGHTTNNQAEYLALRAALARTQELGATHVKVFMDSELIVEQLNRRYKVKDQDLGRRFVEVWNIAQTFRRITFTHIPREKNTEADLLVNRAIDRALRAEDD